MKKIDLDYEPVRYRDERFTDEIKAFVSMDDAVAMYTETKPRFRRIPCPIHDGHDYNFSYGSFGFKCFVCGESGDVITFVEKLFGCDFWTAISKLNDDFNVGLPLYKPATMAQNARLEERYQERLRQREAEEERIKAREEQYNALWDEWCLYDRAMRFFPPESEEYAWAAKHINAAAYKIDSFNPEGW